jgi:integrase
MPQARLTDAFVTKAAPGLYWDTHPAAPRGFGLRVTPAGMRAAWVLNYRRKLDGRERRLTIGDAGSTWPVARAREYAAELRREIDRGGDPLGEAQEKRQAPTVKDLVEQFVADVLPKRAERTQEEYRAMLDRYILPALGERKVAAVARGDLEKLHRKITEAGHSRRANAVLAVAHIIFERAIEWKWRAEGDNPAKRIGRNPEPGRERFLTDAELGRVTAALDRWRAGNKHDSAERRASKRDSTDVILLLLLTGARRGEVVKMTWAQLDLDAGVWTKPAATTKQRKLHRVPLSAEAVELLRRRLAERGPRLVVALRDGRVFPSPGVVARLERDWQVIRASAGLDDVRMHDLRHSYASLLVGSGLSLPIIGALLGHSQVSTTQRYAHLADRPLREATALVGELVSSSGEVK